MGRVGEVPAAAQGWSVSPRREVTLNLRTKGKEEGETTQGEVQHIQRPGGGELGEVAQQGLETRAGTVCDHPRRPNPWDLMVLATVLSARGSHWRL